MNKNVISKRWSRRAFGALMLHAAVFAAAYGLAYCLRFDFNPPRGELFTLIFTLPGVLIIKSVVFYAGGHCHRSWKSVSLRDLTALLRSATLASLVIVALDKMMSAQRQFQGGVLINHVPTGVLLLDWGLTVLLLGGFRALVRLSREELQARFNREGFSKALIVGANQSGEILARQLLADQRLRYHVVGFLDQDSRLHGSTLGGIPVLGSPEEAIFYAKSSGAEHILAISGVLSGPLLRALMDACQESEITIKVIPALDDLLEGEYAVRIRDIDINDLLRREPVQLNNDAIGALIANRVVMVTGAGGSIGSEICRQALKFHPAQLLLVERAENSLFLVEQEFRSARAEVPVVPLLADIADRERMAQIIAEYRPQIVFHAAAHKHVPMMEYNPGEAIKNNVLGTAGLAELADRGGVQEFVMISTDKAVNPTSVMGVSKQLAERFVHAFSETSSTKFVAVRFGNVLASNGSVVPIFQEQIRRGGPITVTHPEIERFFMTIPEASQLVLQAAAMGKGGEIFVLDMGESVRIVDLARDLVRLSGLQADEIEIVFTGLRPGEKLYEELYFQDEEMQPTPHPKVFVAYHRPYTLEEVRRAISDLSRLVHAPPEEIRRKIKELIPEYDLDGQGGQFESEASQTNVKLPRRRTNPVSSSAPDKG